jgi:hypothetical protein
VGVVEYAKVIVAATGVPTTEVTVAVRIKGFPCAAFEALGVTVVTVAAAPTVSDATDEVEPAFARSPL